MPRAGLSSERVAAAGADLADEIGLEAATLSELARRLDVRVASLYSHVRSSQDLRTGIALVALEDLAERVAAALAGRSRTEALSALGHLYRDYAREHPGRYEATLVRLDTETADASAGRRISQMTRAALRGYELSPTDETHAVRLLGSVFHGYISLEGAGGFDHSRPDGRTSWLRILDGLDAMLATWSDPAGSTTPAAPPEDQ